MEDDIGSGELEGYGGGEEGAGGRSGGAGEESGEAGGEGGGGHGHADPDDPLAWLREAIPGNTVLEK